MNQPEKISLQEAIQRFGWDKDVSYDDAIRHLQNEDIDAGLWAIEYDFLTDALDTKAESEELADKNAVQVIKNFLKRLREKMSEKDPKIQRWLDLFEAEEKLRAEE